MKATGNIFQSYLNHLEAERHASSYTIRNYKAELYRFFAYLNEKRIPSLEYVDLHVIRDYLSQLSHAGFAKATVSLKLSAIRSLFRYLVRENWLDSNPLARISSPKLDRHLPGFLSSDEIRLLMKSPDTDTVRGLRNRAIIELLYAAGLRVSELVNLNLENIDLETKELRITGKGNKERIVLIGEPASIALATYLNSGRTKVQNRESRSAVFLNKNGQRLSARSVERQLQAMSKLAGISRKVYPHMIRHTFATHMLDGGADLRVVQELLGHANLSTTQIYTHITKNQARKVYLAAHPMAKLTNAAPNRNDTAQPE